MKLALVTTHPIQYYVPLFELLAKKIELKVFFTGGHHYAYDHDFQREIHWDIPLLTGYDYEFTKKTTAIASISDFKPDHLLIYGWYSPTHFKLLRHFKNKVNILFRGDSNLLNRLPWWKNSVKTLFLKWVYSHVDTALYAGINNKAYFKKYGLKESQLKFVGHVIDNDRFANHQSTGEVRNQMGISDQDLLVLFAGKFNDNKNPLLLLKAFVEIKLKNTHLLFIGSGILAKELAAETAKHTNVHILPFQNQQIIPTFYNACDLFCLPSKSESWGLAINEAMACGKAILVSNKCGAATDLVKQENGLVFNHNELPDLKNKLKYLLSHPLKLKKAGQNSKQIISEWNFIAQSENILKCLYD